MNILQIFEIGAEAAAEIEEVAVELKADEPVTTPPIDVTIDGNKYAVSVTLTPVKAA